MTISGAQAVLKALEEEGVEVVFGIPGGASMPIYDPLVDGSSIRHILCRHEQGAGHAAEGYAWATGKVGVCMATSGPGGTNLVTPIADAKMDSVPIVAITGQVPTPVVGNDAFQEADITGITMPITKHNFLVKDPALIPETVHEAFHIASTGRPGPVLIDLPKDVLLAQTEWSWPDHIDLPGYRPTTKGNQRQIVEAVKLILAAERPVLYVGGGVIKANASEELLRLATIGRLPVVTTLMARGAFPDSNELCLGMPGMHGNYTAVTSLQKADLLIALGTRFDDRVTGKLSAFAPNAKVIHADVDPAEIGKNRRVDVPIVGDCKDVIAKLASELEKRQAEGGSPDRSAWLGQLAEWQRRYPYRYDQQPDGPLKPQFCVERLRDHADEDTIVVAGVGQHQMYASQYWTVRAAAPLDQLGRPGHDGLRGPGRDGREGRAAEQACGRDRRRRVLPDDRPGARHQQHRGHPVRHGDPEQRLPRHGAPVAGAVLRRALLGRLPEPRRARLREARRGLRCGRASRGQPRRGRRRDREGVLGRGPQRRDRLPRGSTRDGVPDDRRGDVERRHHPWSRAGGADRRSHGGADRMSNGNGALHTISVLVEDKPGVLTRVAGLFSARGFNIDSLAVGPTEASGLSRMTIVVNVESKTLEQVTKQLNKLINVIKILEHEAGSAVERELMLVKVRASGDDRARVMEIAEVFRVNVVDVTHATLTLEATGKPEKLEALLSLLADFGVVELSRTGRIALGRGERGIRERVLRAAND